MSDGQNADHALDLKQFSIWNGRKDNNCFRYYLFSRKNELPISPSTWIVLQAKKKSMFQSRHIICHNYYVRVLKAKRLREKWPI